VPRCRMRASNFPCAASPSIWRRPTCPRNPGRFDLPIALGILAASGQIPSDKLGDFEFAGELALTGDLRPVRGALAMTLAASRDRRGFVLPQDNAPEAALVEDAVVYPARSLLQVCAHLAGRDSLTRHTAKPATAVDVYPDMLDVKGQAHTNGHSRSPRRVAIA